ncbi:MAG TPA: rhomboid family intramembrane serine protease [Tepidisphaeraceae bacterium]|nr:rhomboid family intramembrane serine protease [Tepidisphaeraceae bacterium]
MIIPFRTDSPLRRTPYMNWALIAANFAVFFVQWSQNPQAPGESNFVAPLILQPADPHLWQYFTYAFLHAGWLHIIGNMLFLYIFGNNINDRLGHLGYLAFYLAGAVFAGIGYVVVERTAGGGGVLGASGAVAAVTGAYLILLPRSHITIFYFFFFIGVAEIASLWFILLFFALDVVGQIAPQFMGGAEAVAHAAHISGTLFGAAVSIVLLVTGLLPRDPFDIVAMAQRWNRRRVYRDMVTQGYNPFAFTPAQSGRVQVTMPQPTAAQQRLAELRSQANQAVAEHQLPLAASLYHQMVSEDRDQVLSRTAQLDMANYLASQQQYDLAATAYEQFNRFYANYDRIEQVNLMLGMIYSRYLNQPQKAKECLTRAIPRLHSSRELEMAKAELTHIEATLPPTA